MYVIKLFANMIQLIKFLIYPSIFRRIEFYFSIITSQLMEQASEVFLHNIWHDIPESINVPM